MPITIETKIVLPHDKWPTCNLCGHPLRYTSGVHVNLFSLDEPAEHFITHWECPHSGYNHERTQPMIFFDADAVSIKYVVTSGNFRAEYYHGEDADTCES